VNYGSSSTAQTVAEGLASAISGTGLPVVAEAGQNGALTVTASQEGGSGNDISVSITSSTSQPTVFSAPSFSGSSATLSGGRGRSGNDGDRHGQRVWHGSNSSISCYDCKRDHRAERFFGQL
jgi:hypothetical protein